MKNIRLVIMGLALGAAIIAGWYVITSQMKKTEITNFDQCVAAGNPIQESYPEVCRTPEGQAFTRTVN